MLNKSITYKKDMNNIIMAIPKFEKLKGKRILITGATGMIGSALVDILLYANEELKHGMTVFAVGRNVNKLQKRFVSSGKQNGLYFIEHDVINPLEFNDKLDYVIHAASNAHPIAYATDPVGTLMANVVGVYNMLQLANNNKAIRMIFVSSGEVYGQLEEKDIPITEEKSGYVNSMEIRSCYPSGKRAAETLCVAYANQYDIDTVVVRPSHVYGPTATREDSRASTQFINNAVKNENIVLKSIGLQQRSYCYVLDCVSAILTVLLNGENRKAYNIANKDSNVTIREFAEKVAEYGGVEVMFDNPDNKEKKGYTPITRAILSTEKLQQLGWKGKFDADLGIHNTIQILKEIKSINGEK